VRTQGAVRRPCRVHFSSDGVSLKQIFNMLFPFKGSVYSNTTATPWCKQKVHDLAKSLSGDAWVRSCRPATEAEECQNRNQSREQKRHENRPCTIPTQTRPRYGYVERCVPHRRDDSSLFQKPEVMPCSVATFRVTFFCHGKVALSLHRPTDPSVRPSAS